MAPGNRKLEFVEVLDMRSRQWRTILVAVFLSVGLCFSVLAREGKEKGRRRGKRGMNLTEEERQRMKEIREEQRGNRQKAAEEMKKKVDDLAEAMKKDDPDADAIAEAAQEVVGLRVKHALQRRSFRNEIADILPEEQAAKMKERRDETYSKVKEKMKEARDKRQSKRDKRKKRKGKGRGKSAEKREEMKNKRSALREAQREFGEIVVNPDASEDDVKEAGDQLNDALADVCVAMATNVDELAARVDDEADEAAEKTRKRYEKRIENRQKMIDVILRKMSSIGKRAR